MLRLAGAHMNTGTGFLLSILGSLAIAATAYTQAGSRLAVGPDAGGYLCPDGRQLYIKSCYDDSPYANCGVVQMHLPLNRGQWQVETTDTRANILPTVAGCKIYPLEFRNGIVSLVAPKQQAAPAQTAKPAARTITIPGTGGSPVALVRLSTTGGSGTVFYADELSVKSAPDGTIGLWVLQALPNGNTSFPGAAAVWVRYAVNCKQNTYGISVLIEIDAKENPLRAAEVTVENQATTKGSGGEAIVSLACKSAPAPGGARLTSTAAAMADSKSASTAPKPSAPVAAPPPPPPKAVAAKIRLPKTEAEKKFFQMVQSNLMQATINAYIAAPDAEKPVLVKELTDEQGMTALHWAAANGNGAAIRWLLGKDAEVDLADKKGRTPLKIALDAKATNVMTVLLNIGGADARLALPGHDAELRAFKETSERIDFMIKTAAPAKN